MQSIEEVSKNDMHILEGAMGLNIETESETDESGYSDEAFGCSRR